LTSSDVASLLASRHGLAASVAPTMELIGRFFQAGHTRTALSQHGRATTEWDVLSWLAQQEGYDVWVSGMTLYFQPSSLPSGSVAVSPDDCISMEMSRDLAIGAGGSLQVQSWNCALQQVVSASAMYGNGAPNGAQLLAQRIASQLSSHERRVSFEAPADLVTAPRMQLQLYGTNTDFDGGYTIYEVERRFSVKRGFTQHVQARRSAWTIS
jgi:phage protein D